MNRQGSTHMTLSDRIKIQEMLGCQSKLKDIALEISKDDRTVSKEIRKHRSLKINGKYYYNESNLKETCPTLTKYPYVCNGCVRKNKCSAYKDRYFYDASMAQKEYEIEKSESRSGLDISLQDKIRMDAILKEGCQKGQSIAHIISANKDVIPYSQRSIYRLIDENKLAIGDMDLVKKVRCRPRKHKKTTKDKRKVTEGRQYSDFISYISEHNYPPVTEIDTVESVRDGKHKCLLTIHFNDSKGTLAYLLERKESRYVSEVFIKLQDMLGEEKYKDLFKVILTDRGSEFIDPIPIEISHKTGEKLTSVFFCNSYSSYQKGSIEVDHELIRRVIPKGTLMDDYNQDMIDRMISHLWNYNRPSMQSTPYRIFEIMHGKETLDKLKIRAITPDSVTLKPSVLK